MTSKSEDDNSQIIGTSELATFEYWEAVRSEVAQFQSEVDEVYPFRIIQTQKSVQELLKINFDSTSNYSSVLSYL